MNGKQKFNSPDHPVWMITFGKEDGEAELWIPYPEGKGEGWFSLKEEQEALKSIERLGDACEKAHEEILQREDFSEEFRNLDTLIKKLQQILDRYRKPPEKEG